MHQVVAIGASIAAAIPALAGTTVLGASLGAIASSAGSFALYTGAINMGASMLQTSFAYGGIRLDGSKLTPEQAQRRIANGQTNIMVSFSGAMMGGSVHIQMSQNKGSGNSNGRTFHSSYDIPVDENGYTKSSLSLGQKVHKEYKINDFDNIYKFKEYTLPSGKRIDYIDFSTKTIYELKPHNPTQIKLGEKQLQGYLEEIESFAGKGWKTVLDTY